MRFDSETVAKIAAKSMHDYFMHGRRLVCQFLPPEKVHADTFSERDEVNNLREITIEDIVKHRKRSFQKQRKLQNRV